MAGGLLDALYATSINYPIECFRQSRKNNTDSDDANRSFNIALNCYEKFFTDRVFGYVGFSTSMGNIIPHLSPPKNSIHKWWQTHFLIQMSHFNGILTSYPDQMLRSIWSIY